jgi:hypothetical protein
MCRYALCSPQILKKAVDAAVAFPVILRARKSPRR